MPNNMFETISEPELRSRSDVIEALHRLGALVSRARCGSDKTAVPVQARAVAGRILEALRGGVMHDVFETARAGRIVSEVLNGHDATLVAERVTDEGLFTAWKHSFRDGNQRWREAPPGTFPDMPTLRQARIDCTASEQPMKAKSIRWCFSVWARVIAPGREGFRGWVGGQDGGLM